jgi:hypothetical protein
VTYSNADLISNFDYGGSDFLPKPTYQLFTAEINAQYFTVPAKVQTAFTFANALIGSLSIIPYGTTMTASDVDATLDGFNSVESDTSNWRRGIYSAPPLERFDVFGVRFAFTSPDAHAAGFIRRLYGRFRVREGTPDFHFCLVYGVGGASWQASLGTSLLFEKPRLAEALQELEYAICSRVTAAPRRIILHGAFVFARERAVFIAGESGAGKTTLALALAARGYRVGGDDIAFLDATSGVVQPLPRCAHLDSQSWFLLTEVGLQVPDLSRRYNFVTPADLGGGDEHTPPVRHIVLLARGDLGSPMLERVSQAQTEVALLSEAGWDGIRDREALSAIGRLVGSSICHRLVRGELSLTADKVASMLGPPS